MSDSIEYREGDDISGEEIRDRGGLPSPPAGLEWVRVPGHDRFVLRRKAQ